MKTRLLSIISVGVWPLVLFSCSKEVESPIDYTAPEICITASIPDNATKVEAVVPESGVGLDWNWTEGDQLSIASGDAVSLFSIRPGFQGKEASFIGQQLKGSAFDIIYPGEYSSAEALEGISFAEQTQLGNNATDQLKYFALLSGVDAYTAFEFGADWAASHGGSFKQCGVLRFSLTLPEETTVVNRISLKAGAPIFHKGNAADALSNELSIGLTEASVDENHKITAWMNTSWFNDVIAAGTTLTVNVAAGELNWVADITPETDKTIKAGYVNNITLPAEAWATAGRYADGDGTLENPWLIKTPTQLAYMRDDMVAEEMRYFKLVADIDLAGMEWAPLNNADPYAKLLNFDGDGHTIYNLTIKDGASYASFAGVLYGTIKDVTFSGADITAGTGNKCGIVAGYVGTTAALVPCSISGVTVKNSTITAARSMGAFVGQVATDDAIFMDCHVYNTLVTQTATSTCHAGGFVGYTQANPVFVDCTTDATVVGTQYTGGFAGYMGKGLFANCVASGDVSGTKDVGGFVGKTEIPEVVSCTYDGSVVSASDNTKNCHAGGFVGYAAKAAPLGGTFTECVVKNTVMDAAAGQRVGGFVGQADLGNTFNKCAVQEVVVNAGQNSAGFVGVDYATTSADTPEGGIYRCYVEGGRINANGANCGGFVGYPEGAFIENSYTTMAVDGSANAAIGGFIGICNKNVTVKYCYASGAINSTGSPVGAFIGKAAGDATTHVNACIAWNDGLAFSGASAGTEDISGNYTGTEGTLAAKAAELGWDPAIWDFAAKLK